MSEDKEAAAKTEGELFNERFSSEDPFRIEHWYDAIRDYTFETIFLDVDSATCLAMKKYAENVRQWHQCLYFQDTLEERMKVREDSSTQPLVNPESMELLKKLEKRLDEAIGSFGKDGAFVKLSTRSPKDTPVQMQKMRVMIADLLKKDVEKAGGKEFTESEWHCCGTNAFVDACCKMLRVYSGAEAMFLMLESDRVYSDLTRILLVSEENAKIQIAVRRWDPRVVPALEFRAFVYDHKMTACTQYYKVVYDPAMAEHRKEISDLIYSYFEEKLKPLIALPDYTIDFAVTADYKDIICVELNNLPPAAGTALFHWDDPKDRNTIEHGPYEFRVNTEFHDDAFEQVVEPLRLFIDSLRGATPNVHAGVSCDCCGDGSPDRTPDIPRALCGIHGVRYHCKDCVLCSIDMCEDCWKAGWGLRHVNQSKSSLHPNGHTFERLVSPILLPEDAGTPPEGPKTAVPPPPPKKSSGKKDGQDKDKNCTVQ